MNVIRRIRHTVESIRAAVAAGVLGIPSMPFDHVDVRVPVRSVDVRVDMKGTGREARHV